MTRSCTPFWPVLQRQQQHQRRLFSFESFFQKQPTQSSSQQQPNKQPKAPQSPPQKQEQSNRIGTNNRGTAEEHHNNVNRNRISNNNIGNNNSGPSTAWTAYGTSRSNAMHDKQQPQQRQQPDRPWRSSTRVTNQQPAPASSFNLYRQQQQQQQQHKLSDPTIEKQRPPWSLRIDDSSGTNLQDISQLRNAFMKKNNVNTSTTSTYRNNREDREVENGQQKWGGISSSNNSGVIDPLAVNVGVGTKWKPSFYKKNIDPPSSSTPPLSSSSSAPPAPPQSYFQMNKPFQHTTDGGGSNSSSSASSIITPVMNNNEGVKSMEQIMKENAMKQQRNMEQRYNIAGQQVPYNSDKFGNVKQGLSPSSSLPSSQLSFGWRNNNQQQQHHHGRGGGGWQQQQHQGRGGGQQYRQPYNNNNRQQQQQHQYNQRQQQTRQEKQRRQIRKYLPPEAPKEVRLPSHSLTLVDLSLLLRVRKRTIVRTLRSLGGPIAYTTANQDSYLIDIEMMELICIELGIDPTHTEVKKESELIISERRARRDAVDSSNSTVDTVEDGRDALYATLPPRSPVISVMGHVDHGKTTLMDSLRRRAVTATATTASTGSKVDSKKQKKVKNGESSTTSSDIANGDVAGTEAGGITQVITAFEVPLPLENDVSDNQLSSSSSSITTVTFLDTPGHAAFKKMRQSGSLATDVIVLVIAADDGVSPQTIEIINMYKSIARSQPQSISLVIAVSKIDKPGIDIDESVMRIENQLMEHDIFTENVLAGWSGEEGVEFGACQLFPVSGLTGEGLDDLVEGLALQAEIMDLRADEDAMGEGIVIDARMEKGLGVVADCIIRWGSVSRGDFVVSGTNGGRVKFLYDVGNKTITKARPSQPVRIVGFKTLPKAGDPVVCAKSEDEAKELIRLRESELINEERAEYERDMTLQVTGTAAKQGGMLIKAQQKYGFDDNGEAKNNGQDEEESIYIPVVIKADSHGALEAVRDALVSLGTDSKLDIVIDPVEMSTGVITTSDVVMARESDAAIFAFGKVGFADKETKNLAESGGVAIRTHDIVYRLLEDATDFFARYMPIRLEEKIHGKGVVQAVFDVTDAKKQTVSIAGLRVTDGNLFKNKSKSKIVGEESLICFYRVLRDGELLTPDVQKIQASSLRKVKEDVDSVRKGEECGLGLTGFNDLKEGDVVECFSISTANISLLGDPPPRPT
jgi:translation initiation factor IF-2